VCHVVRGLVFRVELLPDGGDLAAFELGKVIAARPAIYGPTGPFILRSSRCQDAFMFVHAFEP